MSKRLVAIPLAAGFGSDVRQPENPLKKKFVIKAPAVGRSTVELVTHIYLNRAAAKAQGLERGTRTIYLGCFSVDLDPAVLSDVEVVRAGDASSGITLRPSAAIDRQPFELNADDVTSIRDWLTQNGGHVRRERERAAAQAEREAAEEVQRLKIEREVRLEVSESIRASVLEELMPSSAVPAIHAAIQALDRAARAVEIEAKILAAEGKKLAPRRTKSLATDSSAVAQLFEATLQLRRDAFTAFERSCQQAGLMVAKTTPKQRSAAA